MASNFSFQPYGLSQQVTVIATAGTVNLNVVQIGGTTLAVSAGNYNPSQVRIANKGTVSVFVQFGAGSTVTVAAASGLELLANTVEVFSVKGQPVMAHISAGTATLCLTPGEGM